MTKYLLDTNICIDLMRGGAEKLAQRMQRCKVGEVAISTVTLAEFYHGVRKSKRPEQNLLALSKFCAPLEVMPFDSLASATYGTIRVDLERRGCVIGPMDLLIAAHAMALGCKVVTNNECEYRRVRGLRVENWV